MARNVDHFLYPVHLKIPWKIHIVSSQDAASPRCQVRGRSQSSTFMKAYREYPFHLPHPPPQKRTLKC